jgi:autotransporter adhesin
VEFLDSVLESSRAQEASIRKETSEKLAAFRKHQEELEKAALSSGGGLAEEVTETWVAASGKKRKKGREKEFLKGVKLRKSESVGDKAGGTAVESKTTKGETQSDLTEATATSPSVSSVPDANKPTTTTTLPTKPTSPAKTSSPPILGLGLGNYSSDEDE